jgi:hypothetical protein
MNNSGWYLSLSMGGGGGWGSTPLEHTDSETDIDFYIVHEGGIVDPCQVCIHAVDRLSGGCSPMGTKCVSRGDEKWI